MTNCGVCSKWVANHSYNIRCHLCKANHHMNSLIVDYSKLDYLKNNLFNCLCQACLIEMFPFNHMENSDEFINECHCRSETGCKTSQLIYNPYDSNRSNFHACSDFDPDLNFLMSKICSLVTYVNTSLKTNLMKIYFHCTALIQMCCLCYMLISAVLEQTW